MGRGSRLTEIERGKIMAFHHVGKSNRWISENIGRSHTVVGNYMRKQTEYGTTTSTGRPSKLTCRDRRRIIRVASNSTKSANQIKAELGLTVSKWTVYRALQKSSVIVRKKLKRAPALKKEHVVKRLQFARENMTTDWKTVRTS